jgi:hypothetical protein
MAYLFLSDEWVSEARAIREEFDGVVPPVTQPVRMNLVVLEVPFGEGSIEAHLDTSDGSIVLDTGHLDLVDLNISIEYETIKSILVDGNAQAVMPAFMSGRIRVEGDLSKLMGLISDGPDPSAQMLAERLKQITA